MPTGYRLLAVRLRTAHLLGDPEVLAALLHPQAHWHRPGAAAGTAGDRDAAAEFLLAEPKDGAGPLAVEETIAFPRAAVLALRPLAPAAAPVYRVFHHNLEQVTHIHDHDRRDEALESADLPAPLC